MIRSGIVEEGPTKIQPKSLIRKISNASTLCSTPPQQDLITIMHSEESRYKRKGFGLFFAFLIASSFFYLSPIICRKWFWPYMLSMINKYQWELWKFNVIFVTIWHAFWVAFINIFMWGIYHLEHPFFERYKIKSKPGPWNQNLEEWKDLLKKSLMLCTFNSMFGIPALIMYSLSTTNWEM